MRLFFLKGKNQKRFSPDEFKFIKNTLSGDLNCQGSIMDSQLKEAKTDTWTVSENGHITSVREIHFPKRAWRLFFIWLSGIHFQFN